MGTGNEGAGRLKERRCVCCGIRAPKGELYRIVRSPHGEVCFDPTGKAPGRGAYVCSTACLTQALKKEKLARALKATLGSDEHERIAVEVAEAMAAAGR